MTISWWEGKLGDLDRLGRETDTRLPQEESVNGDMDDVGIGVSDTGRDGNRVLGMPTDTTATTTGTRGPIVDISNQEA